MKTPTEITNLMFEKDYFSKWLAVERIEVGSGHCKLKMTIRKEMCNGFGIAHGGITYSLADSALAFASNSHGRYAVSVETSISHIRPLKEGDEIIASAVELSATNKIAIYNVRVECSNVLVALFKGTVFIKETEW